MLFMVHNCASNLYCHIMIYLYFKYKQVLMHVSYIETIRNIYSICENWVLHTYFNLSVHIVKQQIPDEFD